MVYFLVGKDNSTLFKKRTTWELETALQAVKDGDVIEFEEDYHCDNAVTITKNIRLIGRTIHQDGNLIFPTLQARICIKDNSDVKIENLCIQDFREKSNAINIKDNSRLIAENVIIENVLTDGEFYPICYVAGHSQFIITNTLIRGGRQIYVENGKFESYSSTINIKCGLKNTKFHIENSELEYFNGNLISMSESSDGVIINSRLSGGNAEKDFPCLWCEDSTIRLEQSNIHQPNYHSALFTKQATLHLTNSIVDSVCVITTKFYSHQFNTIIESVALKDGSECLGDELAILGKSNGKVNLFATKNTRITIESIYFAYPTEPDIKLERNVVRDGSRFIAVEYDEDIEDFKYDEENRLIPVDRTLKTEHFGDRTALEKINDMIGLESIKKDIREFIAITVINKKKEMQGKMKSNINLHSLFLGNPGTGKTTVARLMGKLLHEKGIIATDKYVETSRSDLVGMYIGETAIKTREVLESALGGVLFIDEAYTLATGGEKDYGIEAINEILKFMEDHRGDIVIIFAGYTKDMEEFLDMNEGLRSRIPNTFFFEDYTIEQLIQIGSLELSSQGYIFNREKYAEVIEHNFKHSNDFSNGRWVRNQNEKITRKLALYLFESDSADLMTIPDDTMEESKIG